MSRLSNWPRIGRAVMLPVAALSLGLFAADPAAGQRREAPDALSGQRVRVTAPNFSPAPVVGTVTAYTQEGIRVLSEADSAEHFFPLRSVQRLDIFRGGSRGATASRRIRSYGFLGLAVGALAGLTVTVATGGDDLPIGALAGAGAGLAGGAALGALSGAAQPAEQWSWVVRPWGYDPELRPAN